MSGDRLTPWWYSGGDEPERPDAEGARDQGSPEPESPGGSGLGDWTALLAGAARMVDWATSAVMAPHAEHADPSEHPTCVVCRTITLVGDPIGLTTPDDGAPGEAGLVSEPAPQPEVRWIPVVDEPGETTA